MRVVVVTRPATTKYLCYLSVSRVREQDLKLLVDQLGFNAQCLYIRLISRTGPWFRESKLEYAEPGPTPPILNELMANEMVEKAGALSRGLRQRLAIAQAIIHTPDFLMLDEPASGLDPEARNTLSRLLTSLGAGGMTILVSSHILAELEENPPADPVKPPYPIRARRGGR